MISSFDQNPLNGTMPASARQPISISDARLGQHALEAGHLPHVQLAGHRVHDDAGAEEQQGLEERVGDEVEHAGHRREQPDARRT